MLYRKVLTKDRRPAKEEEYHTSLGLRVWYKGQFTELGNDDYCVLPEYWLEQVKGPTWEEIQIKVETFRAEIHSSWTKHEKGVLEIGFEKGYTQALKDLFS